MKKVCKRVVLVMLLFVLIMIDIDVVSAAEVKLNKTLITLMEGKSYTLKVKGTTKKAIWKSNKDSVASVNKNGKVTAKKKGKVIITATVSKKKYTCMVTVGKKKVSTFTDNPIVVPTKTPAAISTSVQTMGMTTLSIATPITGIKCYNVQDTNFNAKDGTAGKGDASIIDCGNQKYVMIDCGSEKDYSHLKARMLKTCDKSKDYGKIYIPILIISHNHVDHMGAIKKLLTDPDIYVKEVIYTAVGPEENRNKVKSAVGAVKNHNVILTKLVSKAQYKKFKEEHKEYSEEKIKNSGYEFKLKKTYNGTHITVYGPAKKFANHETDELACNNSSMIVTVEGPLKAIFLGDLSYDGLSAATDTGVYAAVFTGDFDFCKFGHHGYRAGSYCDKNGNLKSATSSFAKEIKLYNSKVNAKKYVFTASEERILGKNTNDMDIYYNYLCLKKKLTHNGEIADISIGAVTVGKWSSTGRKN